MVDIHVQALFATPVAAILLPNAQALNAALSETILKRRETHPSITASNIGGWHSTRDLTEWGGAAARELLDKTRSAINQLTADRTGKRVEPNWVSEAWANVNGSHGFNAPHYHPGSFWSASYYVADGGCAADPALGGEFEMFDPRGPVPMMHAPSLKFAGEDGGAAGSTHLIRPRPGLLFIFPSFLIHGVRPYRGTGLRISVAMNFGLYQQAGGISGGQ